MFYESPPVDFKGTKPRRKVVRKHIAEIIDKMLLEAQNGSNVHSPDLKDLSIDKGDLFSEPQFSGDEQNTMNELGKDGFVQTTPEITVEQPPICAEQFNQMLEHLEELKSLVSECENDKTKVIYGMNVSNIKWLVDFIEMIKQRGNLKGVEQNISIAYCSSFLPILEKIPEKKEASLPFYSPPEEIDFDEPTWF